MNQSYLPRPTLSVRQRARIMRVVLGGTGLALTVLSGCHHARRPSDVPAQQVVWLAVGPREGATVPSGRSDGNRWRLGPGWECRTVAVSDEGGGEVEVRLNEPADAVVIEPMLRRNEAARSSGSFRSRRVESLIGSVRRSYPKARVLVLLPGPTFDVESRPDAFTEAVGQFSDAAYAAEVETVFAYGDRARATEVVNSVLSRSADPGFDVEKDLRAAGRPVSVRSFYGFRQLGFRLENGSEVTLVKPWRTASGRPIAWRGEFFGHQPQVDLALLNRGYHVVYVKAQNLYGAPAAMRIWEQVHALLRGVGLDGKIVLVGFSRGGLYCYAWAALHPETVAVLYGDAPVCDFKSWPGLKGRSTGPKGRWAELLRAYGFKSEAEALVYPTPIDKLPILAAARIPIVHVIGEADTDAPPAENSDRVEARYLALGGEIKVIRKPGVAHHPHSLPDPTPIVEFILRCELRAAAPPLK